MNVYEVDKAKPKANLTVIQLFLWLFTRISALKYILKSVPEGWKIELSECGWMTKNVFFEYISKVLYPQLGEKKNYLLTNIQLSFLFVNFEV